MTRTRPTAPSTLRMGAEANGRVTRPRPPVRPLRRPPSYTRCSSTARRRVCLPSSVSAPPSASSGASRRWPASISTSPRARSCCSRARTAPARPRCCGCSPGWCRCTPGRRRCSATISPTTAAARAATSRSSGHETFCYDDLTVRENLRFAARAAGRDTAAADAALERLGLGSPADVVHRRLSAGQRRRLALAVALRTRSAAAAARRAARRARRRGPRGARRRRAPRRPPRAAPCCSRRTSSSSPARSPTARSCSPPGRRGSAPAPTSPDRGAAPSVPSEPGSAA